MIQVKQSQNGLWFEAIKHWQDAIGISNVLIKKDAVAPYLLNTIDATRTIKGVLKPQTTQDVQNIVLIAQRFQTPLYPISGGKNWGYGSACPVGQTSFIVDLSSMNQILDFDEELGVLTVQPGVTQKDLEDFLKDRGDHYMVPTTGAGPTASILGNALERGYGLTPHSDHFEAITAFEAILPNGGLYTSALDELGGKKINGLFKWGLGPYLDGIFTQGNFGIVTQGTLKLAHRPETVCSFFFSLKNDECLEAAIVALRKIKTELGNNLGAINLMNLRRVLSMLEPFPEGTNENNLIIDDNTIKALAKKHLLTEWTGFGAIYGRTSVVKAVQKIIKTTLKPYTKRMVFLTEKSIAKARMIRYILPSFYKNTLKPKLDTIASAIENVSGRPSQVALPLAYWRSSKKPDMTKDINPALDNCGLIWHAPLIPLTPTDIRKHVTIVNGVCIKHNINPLITLTIFSEQCCDSTIPILFDRCNEIETINAKNCQKELLKVEGAEGYLPYRIGIDAMKSLINPESTYWKFAATLKNAIDPNQIIAPGRYIPANEITEDIQADLRFENNELLPLTL